MKRRIGALLLVASLAGCTIGTPEVIFEDDPRWDCTTMGNRGCGVQDTNGTWWVIEHDDAGQPVAAWTRAQWLAITAPELLNTTS